MGIENETKPVSRKKFVAWSLALLSAAAGIKYLFRSRNPHNESATIKVLTQDGKLVEVEVSKLSRKKRKIKDGEIFTWVKRKPS